jgi:WG containing repeat
MKCACGFENVTDARFCGSCGSALEAGLGTALPDAAASEDRRPVDKTGKVVISPQFDVASEFSQGLAAVRIGDDTSGKYGYIDKTGHMIITPTFDYGDKFSEGLARVRIGGPDTGKWGYIYR